MNVRRQLTIVLGAAPLALTGALRAQAQSGQTRRVGQLTEGGREQARGYSRWFYDEMARLGWVEGRNIAYEIAAADGKPELLARAAAELASRPFDVLLCGSPRAALALKQATTRIPIVFAGLTTPVEMGLVASLARPGGNVTGASSNLDRLLPKRVQLLRDILPRTRRVGVLRPPVDAVLDKVIADIRPGLAQVELALMTADVTDAASVEPAIARLAADRAEAIVDATLSPVTVYYNRDRVIEVANRARLPFVATTEAVAQAGALFSYGGSPRALTRATARLVDRVLRGANPADIPIESVDEYDFVVNLKAAKLLGIDVPKSVLLRADRVIE